MTAFPVVEIDTERSRWSDGVVFGLGDAIAEARVLDRPLSEWGPERTAPSGSVKGPAFVVGRDLWVSDATWDALAFAAQSAKDPAAPVRLVRDKSGVGGSGDPLGRLPHLSEGDDERVAFDLWFLPGGCEVSLDDVAALEAAQGVDIEGRTRRWELPADPEVTGGEPLRVTFAAAVCAPVSHWVEVLRANLLALGAQSLEGAPLLRMGRYFGAAVRGLSFRPDSVMRHMSRIGTGCSIHPSAVVEACRVGDFVEIGPGAVLKGCYIADEVRIEAQAIRDLSIIGKGARVQRRAMANVCVLYPGARMGGILQLGVAGRDSAAKMFAVGTDMRLAGKVRVQCPDDVLREVDIGYQGVCLGHRSFVGSGVWIAPGRVIEAERKVTRTKEQMVM